VTGSAAQTGADVCLVSMPYASLTRPSLALGLLSGILAAEGFRVKATHANLWFAESVGLRLYEQAESSLMVFLSGEWTFAAAAFGDDPRREAKDAEYLRQVREAFMLLAQTQAGQGLAEAQRNGDALVRDLWALRAAATLFVDEVARRVLATGARVVGCTSTFEQHVASLALLRRIRELDPGVITMMGGANCETVMGETTHRCFPWVDYVVSGEADGIIADLCRLALTRGRDVEPEDLPRAVLGPGHRKVAKRGGRAGSLPRGLFSDLDSLPTPQFDDYFQTLESSSLRDFVRPGLPVETSRGCWWGAVHQCTFCGLNGTGMGYRSKSAERVLAELNELEDRYGISDFEVVDNILDMGYFKSLLPMLAADGRRRCIFYEIKANVTRERVADMIRAGIIWVQPGIENLHTEVLRLMDKGIKGWQNVQLLKWAREFGMKVAWSVLWGFPGEKDDWYREFAGWLPALEHLQPPFSVVHIRFDRYSVYHEQARRFGLVLFPIGAMSFVYPVAPGDLGNLTYFFSTEPGAAVVPDGEKNALQNRPGTMAALGGVTEWQVEHASRHSTLCMEDHDGVLEITDTRSCARAPGTVLTGLARAVCLACDTAPRPGNLAQIIGRDFGITATDDEIAAVVSQLLANRFVLAIDDRLVGLVVNGLGNDLTEFPFPGGSLVVDGLSGRRANEPMQSAAGPVK
jgi:ribosomal peptide maturation radical SAM protein 1